MRRCVVVASVLLSACGAAAPGPVAAPSPSEATPSVLPSPSPTAPAPPEPAIPTYSAARAKRHVRVLAGRIGPRPAGSRGYRRAVRYVRSRLDALGYDTRLQAFRTSDGSRSWNVIGRLPGGSNELLIGGHLDTVAGAPGGNDNASGIAVLLEVARVLAGTPEGRAVELVAFGAEERQPAGGHHVGSRAYVRRMAERPRMMVSVDMVGRYRPVIVGRIGIGPPAAVRALRRAGRAAGIPTTRRILPDVSDHGPFERAGVAAAFVWTGPHADYHSAADGPEDAQRKALRRVGRLLLAFIRAEAGPDAAT